MSDLEAFQARLGHQFADPVLLRLALTHPSVAHEQSTTTLHNQRLEFLGDAVLQLCLTRELYLKYPSLGEGPLTKARAQMVNQKTLAACAQRLELGEVLILSRGEEANGGRKRPSILADAFEAVLGAIFLDAGYEVACHFVMQQFVSPLAATEINPHTDNPKGELQEILQAQSSEAPQYQLHSASGPDHDREFECTVHYRGEEIGRGRGKSKKSAESEAAAAALVHMRQKAGTTP